MSAVSRGKSRSVLQPVLFFAEQKAAFMEKGDVIAQLFEIADDMGGNQDGMVLVPVNS